MSENSFYDGRLENSLLTEALVYDEVAGAGRHCIFDSHVAKKYSCYAGLVSEDELKSRRNAGVLYEIPHGQLHPSEDGTPAKPLAQTAHTMFRAHISSELYPCLGAKAAFHQLSYRFGFYKHLGELGSVAAMGRDLRRFINDYEQLGNFSSFVAVFNRPLSTTPDHFELLLWKHLQMLHEHDDSGIWDPHYSADPESPDFAFSFLGCAFFVVGQHPGAERFSRRYLYPTLVFNPESQIRRLREQGGLEQFAAKVRQRDIVLQGSINPLLPADKSTTGGEAAVYASNHAHLGGQFKCPFRTLRSALTKFRSKQK